MYQNSKLPLRKSSNDNKHRLFQILSQIKESISKRRFNHAYQMGSKYYEQNKTILTNEEIYQLCWNCCKAIQNKIYHRLTIKKKKYVPPVTQSHIQHLFSLQMSLHAVLLPEIVKTNEKYFNMLGVQNEGLNPKEILGQQMAFQRKAKNYFLDNTKVKKQVKRVIKQHLKICNTVLMYKINHLKNQSEIKEIFEVMEDIYKNFEEKDFPSQHMDYTLIKLSLIQMVGSTQYIPCFYQLPLGYLSKLYQKMRKDNQNAIEHYLDKLASFLVLTLRHLPIKIEDMFILSSQIQYITKILNDKYQDISSKGYILKKKVGLNVKRQVTIDKQSYEDSIQRLSRREDSVSTYNKFSEKKVESKRNIRNTYHSLKNLSQLAIDQIERSMNCRREVIQIVLRYFTLKYLQKSRGKDTQQLISGQILLNNQSRKDKKKSNIRQNSQSGLSSQKRTRRNFKTLTSMLRDIRVQKKSSSLEDGNQVQKFRVHTSIKEQGKFIIKNVGLVSKHNELIIGYFNVVNNLLQSVENYQRNTRIQQPSLLDRQDVLEDFQLERLEKIKSFKDRLRAKSIKYQNNMKEPKEQINQIPIIKQKQSKKINLLSDVIQNNIIKLLQLPFNEINSKNRSYSSPVFKKLEALKAQTQNLNTERKYLVQKLLVRKAMSLHQGETGMNQHQLIVGESQFRKQKDNREQIYKIPDNFTQKIDKYIQNNKKLMKIDKSSRSPFTIKILEKSNMKLKLDKKHYKKLPELTFQKLQQQYNKLQGKLQKEKIEWQMTLSSQFDKLRRDAAKNQFLNQNERKHKNQSMKQNNTILQVALDDDIQQFY